MKSIILSILIIIPFISYSQSEHFAQRNSIRTSPFEFGKAEFQLGYEYYWPDRKSSIIILPSIVLKDSPQEVKEGLMLETQYRFYISHLRSDERHVLLGFHNIGFYTGIYGRYTNYKEEYDYTWWNNQDQTSTTQRFEKKVTAGEGGILIGFQMDITKRILIDFFIGGGIRYPRNIDTKTDIISPGDYYNEVSVFDMDYKGVKPKVGFQLGFMF